MTANSMPEPLSVEQIQRHYQALCNFEQNPESAIVSLELLIDSHELLRQRLAAMQERAEKAEKQRNDVLRMHNADVASLRVERDAALRQVQALEAKLAEKEQG